MAVELATAYFTLLPSMKGTAAAVQSQIGAVSASAAGAGTATGAAMGGGVVAGFGRFVPVLGGLLAGAGLVSIFQDSAAAASDLTESTNAVKVTFGDLADEIGVLGDTAAARLGLSQNQFNGLATQFSSFAGTIAGEGGNVVGVIDELTTRGADFASVYNLDVNEALRLFQSGLAGETEPLRKFGIDLSAASVNAFAYANGIAESGTELTEAEKVQARYASLLEQTSKTQGDFANTSDGLANSQRILSAEFEDARAELGEALLPALTKLTEFGIEKGVPFFTKLVDLFIKLEPVITPLADALLSVLGFLIDINAFGFIQTLLDQMSDGKVTAQELLSTFGGFAPVLVGVVNAISGVINGFIGGVEGAANAAIGLVNGVLAALGLGRASASLRFARVGTISVPTGVSLRGRIGKMAAGGIVTARPGGIVANVGEGRDDEAVIPLRPDVLAEIGAGISGVGGGNTDRLLKRLIEAVESRQIIEADGVQIARTTARGSAFGAAIGAT